MARTFTSGTSTDGGGSGINNAATIQGLYHTGIIANAAWSLVEQMTPAGYDNRVYKCAAASSGLPKDFYVAICRATASGVIYLLCGEDYNSSTHVLTNCCTAPFNGTRAIDSAGLQTASVASATLNVSVNYTNNALAPQVIVGGTAFWVCAVDIDGLTIACGTAFAFYAGTFTSLVQAPVTDPMPLCMFSFDGSGFPAAGSANSGVSRMPGVTTPAPAYSWGVGDGQGAIPSRLAPYTPLTFASPDLLQGGGAQAYPVLVLHTHTSPATTGFLRGLLKHHLAFGSNPSGGALGDTVTIGGTTWVFLNNYPHVVDSGV